MIRFDSNGNRAVSVTDGSIIAFATNGVDLGFYGGTKFKTPSAEPAYFAVIKGQGLVHLKGAVSVSTKNGKTIEMKADDQSGFPKK